MIAKGGREKEKVKEEVLMTVMKEGGVGVDGR
jgi:hypothetical protein